MTARESCGAFAYWAKAEPEGWHYHSVIAHAIDATTVCAEILDTCPRFLTTLERATGLDADWLRPRVPCLVGLHDIGKLSPGFQLRRPDITETLQGTLPDWKRGYNVYHDTLGDLLWRDHLSDLIVEEDLLHIGIQAMEDEPRRRWQRGLDALFAAVAGHHGVPPERSGPEGFPLDTKEHFLGRNIEDAKEHVRTLCDMFCSPQEQGETDPPPDPQRFREASWILAGLTVVSDWLASSTDFFPLEGDLRDLPKYRDGAAERRARQAVQASGLLHAKPSAASAFDQLFPEFNPTPVQDLTSNLEVGGEPELFIIEDLTGSGKTEAALALTSRIMGEGNAEGLYFALPTMATSNAMYDRIVKAHEGLFEQATDVILAHGQRDLHDGFKDTILGEAVSTGASDQLPGPAVCSAWLADSRKKALLGQVGVGTLDQALLSVLPVRHQSLRMAGLLGKVLVADEVHAFDAYTQTLLEGLLTFQALSGGSSILLSATLPQGTKASLVAAYRRGLQEDDETKPAGPAAEGYPLVTHATPVGREAHAVEAASRSQRAVDVTLIQPAMVEEQVIDHAVEGKCVVWIRNTVREAKKTARLLRSTLPADRVHLFHARFTNADRSRIEGDVLDRFGPESTPEQRNGHILVATQVAEQSLDLDFDEMFTDLAPIDLLIQRAGRLQRHARTEEGGRLDPDQRDRRGSPVLHVAAPDPGGEVSSDWVERALPGTSYVYTDHGQLWLTADLIERYGGWSLPGDARTVIEEVYGPSAADRIPDELDRSSVEAEGEARAHRSLSLSNQLTLSQGYEHRDLPWDPDIATPTRLGDPQIILRLGTVVDDALVPLAPGERAPWQANQVSCRASLIPDQVDEEEQERLLSLASPPMGDGARWVHIVALEPDPDGRYRGSVLGEDGRSSSVMYSPAEGLTVEREGGV